MPFACLIHLGFTFWILSNRQMFGNQVFPIQRIYDVAQSGHLFINALKDLAFDQSFPVFVTLCLFVVVIVFSEMIGSFLAGKEDRKYREDLKNYFDALDIYDKRHLVNEESYYREKHVSNILFNVLQ